MEKMRICLGQIRDLDPTSLQEQFQFAHQLGVKSVQFNTPTLPGETEWSYEDLLALKTLCDDNGLFLETIENVPIQFYDKVLLGLPGRDEQIENYKRLIRNMGKVGIPVLGYHFVPTFVWRTTQDAPGRGGARVTGFDGTGEETKPNTTVYWARTDMEIPDPETMWDNYTYFMKAVIPTAEEAGVKLALHPDDPPVPIVSGVARLFINFEAFKRAEEIANSDAWGIDLCLGCCSEWGGANGVEEMIKYFGPRGKIAYVHFRDVQGTVPQFQECFLGEGNFSPAKVIRLLKEVDFKGYIMDDHVPKMVNDTSYGHRARGYTIGYMQGLVEMMEHDDAK